MNNFPFFLRRLRRLDRIVDDDDGEVNTRGPLQGIAVARQIAMFSYRSHDAYETKFGRRVIEDVSPGDSNGQDVVYDVERYLQYQGQKFLGRFDPLSYVKCTRMMDSHDVSRGRGTYPSVLARVK